MVKFILRHGMNAEKLVLGIPLFGRTYTLAASTLPAPGAATSGWGDEGPYTQTKGLLAYFEVSVFIVKPFVNRRFSAVIPLKFLLSPLFKTALKLEL